ncbi:MAG: hypothetical protein IJL32_09350 [Oscillospiraceae bacterium]|nr:hypothetical protein [Oscillospiraceae bacterium]
MIGADLAKLELIGIDYLYMLYDSRLREVCFRSYVTDALGFLAGIQERWADKAYNLLPVPLNVQEPPDDIETRSTSEIAASIIDGLGAILEKSDNE